MSLFKSCHKCAQPYDDCKCDMFKTKLCKKCGNPEEDLGYCCNESQRNEPTPTVDLDSHYKTGNIEPFDVMEDMGILEPFCLGNIIKYAMRCQHKGSKKKDLLKIAEYANKLASKL